MIPSGKTIIVDASVAVKWVCEEVGSDRAAALLHGYSLAAPVVWLIEAANAIWRRARRGELTPAEAHERVAALSTAPIRAVDPAELVPDAVTIACDLGHPVYDCLYLVAAMRQNGHIVTADRRFHAVAAARAVFAGIISLL